MLDSIHGYPRCRTVTFGSTSFSLLLVILLAGCGAPPPSQPALAYIEFPTDTGIAGAFLDRQKNVLAVLADKNSQGVPTRLTGLTVMKADGTSLSIFTGEDGLPERIVAEGWVIALQNYTDSTVDAVIIAPDGSATQRQGLSVAPAYLAALRSSIGADTAKAKSASTTIDFEKLQAAAQLREFDTLNWANTMLGLGSCLLTLTGPVTGGVGTALGLAGCTTAVVSSLNLVFDSDSLGEAVGITGTAITALECGADIVGGDFFSAALDCNNLFADVSTLAAANADGESPAVHVLPRDIYRPNVTITSPSSGEVFRTPTIEVIGNATDQSPSSGLTEVEVRVNGGPWHQGSGTTEWRRSLDLSPGNNSIECRARDESGLLSAAQIVSVTMYPAQVDDCPDDPEKTTPGVCGCGQNEVDTDGDGLEDCIDLCPLDENKSQPGDCGCEQLEVPGCGNNTDSNGLLIYWTDICDNELYRTKASAVRMIERLVYDANLYAIAIDPNTQYIYLSGWQSQGYIARCRLDGSDYRVLKRVGSGTPNAIAVDTQRGFIYWTQPGKNAIFRAQTDGERVEEVVSYRTRLNIDRDFEPRGIAFDPETERLYWSSTYKIQTDVGDSSFVTDIIAAGLHRPLGLALDFPASMLYWAEIEDGDSGVARAKLDGSSYERIVTDWALPSFIALDKPSQRIYWTDSDFGAIERSALDGTHRETVIGRFDASFADVDLSCPSGIALYRPTEISARALALFAYANVDHSELVLGESTTLRAACNDGTEPYNYFWTAEGWSGVADRVAAISPVQTTTYTVTVTDSSSPPQQAKDSITVRVVR